MHFLSIWLSGIMSIMKSFGDRAFPWNIPLWTFASPKLLLPAVNSPFQVFMVFSIKFMTSSGILYILKQFIIQILDFMSYAFYSNSRLQLDFSVWSWPFLGCADLCKVNLLCLRFLCGIISIPQETIHGLFASSKSHPYWCCWYFPYDR